jgi:hypothetical protein
MVVMVVGMERTEDLRYCDPVSPPQGDSNCGTYFYSCFFDWFPECKLTVVLHDILLDLEAS